MKDYIERDIWKSLPDDLPYKASVKRVLMQAPAADVRPVVRGKWIIDNLVSTGGGTYQVLRCSICECSEPWLMSRSYCPHCGAEMVTECHQLEEGRG